MLVHVICFLREEYVLASPFFIEWVNKSQMLLHFPFVNDLDQFELVEVLLALFDERTLTLDVRLCHICIKELIFIIVNDGSLALQQDIVEPFPVISKVVLISLVDLEARVVLACVIVLEVPLHADFSCEHTPGGHVVSLIQANELVVNLSGCKVVVALFSFQ